MTDGLSRIACIGTQKIDPAKPNRPDSRISAGRRALASFSILALSGTGLAFGSTSPAHAATPLPIPGKSPVYLSGSDGTVRKIAADGTKSTVASNLESPHGLAADAAGNLFVVEEGASRVVKIASNGTKTTVADGVDESGQPDPNGLADPKDVDLDSSGNVYIADLGHHRIAKVGRNGSLTTYADVGQGELPWGVAVDSSGNVYTVKYWAGQVVKISKSGKQTILAQFDGGSNSALNDVDVDNSGNVYVSEQRANTVWKIDPDGTKKPVGGQGTLGNPDGVAVDALKNVFVSSYWWAGIEVPAGCDKADCQIRLDSGLAEHTHGVAVSPQPRPPSMLLALPGKGRATVLFHRSSSPSVTSYTVTATDLTDPAASRKTASGAFPIIQVSGLTPKHRYTFDVTATNAAGSTSLSSRTSLPVTIR